MGEVCAGASLKRDGIFQIVAEELFRKGHLQDNENRILVKLARFLRLEPEDARTIVKVARMALADSSSSSDEGDTALRIYTRVSAALRTADGLSAAAEQVLHALRVLFGLPELSRRTGAIPVPPELRPTGQVPVLAVDKLPEPEAGPLEEAARLARLEQYDESVKAAERIIAVRPPPAGFADGYRQLLPSLVQEAAGEPTPGRVLPLVKWAARLAALPPEETYRWQVLIEVASVGGPILAKTARWDEHAGLAAELERVIDTPQGVYAPAMAQAAADGVERCLTGDRYDESKVWHKLLVKQQPFLPQEAVRALYATSLVRQMEYLVGHREDGKEHFTTLLTSLQNLMKAYPADRAIARAFATVSPSIGVIYLKARDAAAIKDYLGSIVNTVRNFPGDEELAVSFGKGLVNTAILAKDLARQAEAEKSTFRRFMDQFKKASDPVAAEVTIAMGVAVASVPHSNAMSDLRKRFEGLSGARLLVTQKIERPKNLPRPTVKASRLSRA